MAWKKAKLVTRNFLNGREAIREEVPLGKIYMVDTSTKRMAVNHCTDGEMPDFNVEVVPTMDGGWLPLEVLEIEGEVEH